MKTKQKPPFTEVALVYGPSADYINPVMNELFATYSIFLKRGSIFLARSKDGPTKRLMDEFPVEGLGYSASGELFGVVLKNFVSASVKTICITMDELRTPKKLAARLEELGLIPPTFADELNAVAAYIGALAKLNSVTVIDAEGLHWLGNRAEQKSVGVLGTRVVGHGAQKVVPIIRGDKAYVMHGQFSVWQIELGRLLRGNHLLINATIFGLVPPLAKLLNYAAFGYFVPYAKDTPILSQLISNLTGPARQPKLWLTRSGGLDAYIIEARDRVITLEEHGRHGGALVREAMHLHESRPLACEPGQQGAGSSGGGAFIFATGGSPMAPASAPLETSTDYESRLITLVVDEAYGVISQLNGLDSVNAFVAKFSRVTRSHYGLAGQIWFQQLLNNQDKLQTFVPEKLRSYGVKLAGSKVAFTSLTAVERQVLHHFAFTAVVGWVAIRLNVLPLRLCDPLATAKHLFAKWLREWRGREVARESAPLKILQAFLFTKSSSFLPLEHSNMLLDGTAAVYIKDHKTHGRLFLHNREYFENVLCKDCGVVAMVAALRAVHGLVSDEKGRTLNVRMPGGNPGNGNRMSFYAIKESVRFSPGGSSAVVGISSDSPTTSNPKNPQKAPHA